MGQRLQLQVLLEELLGSRNVYFQPPESLRMQYPAIVYNHDYESAQFASNVKYRNTKRYQLTVIHDDPDSDLPDKVTNLPLCTFERSFTAEQLYHKIYSLYF